MNKKSKYRQKIRRNITLFPYYNFFRRFRAESVILIIYFGLILNSYAKAMSIITIYTISFALMEIPTSIISDKIGRRFTLVSSSLFMCLKYIFFIIGIFEESYLVLLVGAVLYGIGSAFESETDKAIIFESMREMRKSKKFHNALGKVSSIAEFSLCVSALVGGVVAQKSYIAVFFISLFMQICAFTTTLFFREPKLVERSRDNPLKHFKESLRIIISRKKLRNMSIARIIFMSNSYSSHMIQPVFFKSLIPIWLIGFTRTLKHIFGSLGFWFSGKIIDKLTHIRALIGSILVMNSVNIFAILISSILTPFISAFSNFFYGVEEVSRISLFQKEFTDAQRATMGSAITMFANVMFGIMGFIGGLVADLVSPQFSLILLEVFALFSAWVYYRTLREK